MPSSENIEVMRRDDYQLTFTITNEAGAPQDVTNDSVTFCVKRVATDADADALILQRKIPTDPSAANGVVVFQLDAADTNIVAGSYPFDVQWVRTSTGNSETITVMTGSFKVTQDVAVGL